MPRDAVGRHARNRGAVGDRRNVRRDDNLRMTPERTRFRQRFDLEYVERRAGEMTGVDRGYEIALDEVTAARGIDHIGAFRKLREGLRVQDMARLVRQRQHADQNVALRQK